MLVIDGFSTVYYIDLITTSNVCQAFLSSSDRNFKPTEFALFDPTTSSQEIRTLSVMC
mgnify:CR=1 FL=1